MGVSLRIKKYASGTQTYYLDIYSNGKRSFEFLDIQFLKSDSSGIRKEKKELAENIRAKRQLELESLDHGIIPKHRRKAEFNSYYLSFLEGYKKNDKRMFKYAYEKFSEYTGYKVTKAFEVTPKLIEGFKGFLESEEAGLSGETPYDYFRRFKSVIKAAFKDGLISQSNYLHIADISMRRKSNNSLVKQILTKEELSILKSTQCGNEEVKRAFLFACFTGLGEAEIRNLTWSKINNEKITLFREKSGEQIINKLPKTALELLGPKNGKADELVFTLPSTKAVSKNIKNWVRKAEVEKNISFYCGRHTFAVLLLLNGANLKTVADCMGHTTTQNTIKYLKYVDELKSEALSNMPEL